MATFTAPGQNLTFNIPEEGQVFADTSGPQSIYKRIGSELVKFNVGNAGLPVQSESGFVDFLKQQGIDYGALPKYNIGDVGSAFRQAFGTDIYRPGIARDISEFKVAPVASSSETFTQTNRPDNPNSAVVTSSKTGTTNPGVGLPAGVAPTGQTGSGGAPINTQTPSAGVSVTPGSISTHTVQAGDTLSEIAQRYGVPTSQITGYRSGNPNLIFPGEVLNINKQPALGTPPPDGAAPDPSSPTALPSPQTGAMTPGGGFDDIFAQYGLSTKNSVEDIVKSISKLYGLDSINKEMETLDTEHIDAVAKVNDNPWISEGLRSKEVTKLQDKYEQKKNALVNRLRLNQDVVGKAIDMYYKERSFQQENLFKALDLRAKEIELAVKSQAQKEASDGLTFKDQLQFAAQLRDDARLDPDIKIFSEVRQAYETIAIQAKRGDAVGDLTLLRLYAKLTDPTSSVREEEFESMESAQGALARRGIRLTKGQITGERLMDSTRAQFVSAAKQIYESRERNYNLAIDRIQRNASDVGVDPSKIISPQPAVIPVNIGGGSTTDFGISEPLTAGTGGFLSKAFNWLFGS